MSSCGRTTVHDPHPFVTTRGGFPPEKHTEQCSGVAESPSSESRKK